MIYGLLIAGLWQGTGLVMCLMLAGLRGIDEDIWKAVARRRHPDVEDLSLHRHADDAPGLHHHARHRRRPASSSSTTWSSRRPAAARASPREVPAKYVYDYMFRAQNLGQGFAASTMMLLTVADRR